MVAVGVTSAESSGGRRRDVVRFQLSGYHPLRFDTTLPGRATVEWRFDERANVVTGRIVLHAGVSEDEIVSWAEVVVDNDRDARAARRVAVRYMRDSGGLVRVEDEEEKDERSRTRARSWPLCRCRPVGAELASR